VKNKIQKFRLYQNKFKQWILDYPKYKGNLEELVLKGGAGMFCDLLSEGQDEFILTLSDEKFNGALPLIKLGEDKEIGGYRYFLPSFDGKDFNLEFWIGEPIQEMFGNYPKTIYFSRNYL
jgi:hypothetical protein